MELEKEIEGKKEEGEVIECVFIPLMGLASMSKMS